MDLCQTLLFPHETPVTSAGFSEYSLFNLSFFFVPNTFYMHLYAIEFIPSKPWNISSSLLTWTNEKHDYCAADPNAWICILYAPIYLYQNMLRETRQLSPTFTVLQYFYSTIFTPFLGTDIALWAPLSSFITSCYCEWMTECLVSTWNVGNPDELNNSQLMHARMVSAVLYAAPKFRDTLLPACLVWHISCYSMWPFHFIIAL